jgi:hypothetical protein
MEITIGLVPFGKWGSEKIKEEKEQVKEKVQRSDETRVWEQVDMSRSE